MNRFSLGPADGTTMGHDRDNSQTEGSWLSSAAILAGNGKKEFRPVHMERAKLAAAIAEAVASQGRQIYAL